MALTSIHICPVKAGAERHNERRKELDYIRPELSRYNETYHSPDHPENISQCLAQIKADYSAAHGKKLHAKATPIREAIVVIGPDTTMGQLRNFCFEVQKRWGISMMSIYTHRDEGHWNVDKIWKPNHHAHIEFNWYNQKTHTTHKLSRQDMAEMQTLLAECLGMERGVSSDKKHLSAIQQKNEAEAAKLHRLQEQVQQQKTLHKTELEKECKDLRHSGIVTVRAFDYLCRYDAVKPTDKQQTYRNNLEQECHRDLPTNTIALADHAEALRLYLYNTIDAVRSIGEKLQKLAAKIPILKRRFLAREAKLEKDIAIAENHAKMAENRANQAEKELANIRLNRLREQHTKEQELETSHLFERKLKAVAQKLTSMDAETLSKFEKMGLREHIGASIWDNAKQQHQQRKQ